MISNIAENENLILDSTAVQSLWIQKQEEKYVDAQINSNIFYNMMYDRMVRSSSNLDHEQEYTDESSPYVQQSGATHLEKSFWFQENEYSVDEIFVAKNYGFNNECLSIAVSAAESEDMIISPS